jgi:glutaredoxin-like protein NrdH
MKPVVYTNPNCIQCDMTKKFLDNAGIEYDVENLQDESNAEKVTEFINMGFKAAPIVVTKNDIWSGYKLDKLKEIN